MKISKSVHHFKFLRNQNHRLAPHGLVRGPNQRWVHGKMKRKPFVLDPVLQTAYQGELAIGHEEHQDLMSLCAAGIVPQSYHAYYKDLSIVEGNPDENKEDFMLFH